MEREGERRREEERDERSIRGKRMYIGSGKIKFQKKKKQ